MARTTGKREVRYELSYSSDAEMLLDFERQIAAARDETQVSRLVACFTAISGTAALWGDITVPEEAAEVAFYARLGADRSEQLRAEQAALAVLDALADAARAEVHEDELVLV